MATKTQNTNFIDIVQSSFVGFNLARSKTLWQIVQAMSSTCSVNLVKIAAAMKSQTIPASTYRRVQRFIHDMRFDSSFMAQFLLNIAGIKSPYTLILDRTNWNFGKSEINFLVLSAYVNGWCIPIMWSVIPKDGSSSQEDRIELLRRFISTFGKGCVNNFLGDREFVGEKWIAFLIQEEIPFDIRLRENMNVVYKGVKVRLRHLFKNIPLNKLRTIRCKVALGTNWVYLQCQRIQSTKTGKVEFLIVASDCEPEKGIERYATRWYIENMFKNLKSNGFNLTDTHVTNPERLSTLMGILAIAYAWMIRIGLWVKKVRPKLFKKKKHKRPSKSIFRAGLEAFLQAAHIQNAVMMRKYLKFMSCT